MDFTCLEAFTEIRSTLSYLATEINRWYSVNLLSQFDFSLFKKNYAICEIWPLTPIRSHDDLHLLSELCYKGTCCCHCTRGTADAEKTPRGQTNNSSAEAALSFYMQSYAERWACIKVSVHQQCIMPHKGEIPPSLAKYLRQVQSLFLDAPSLPLALFLVVETVHHVVRDEIIPPVAISIVQHPRRNKHWI